MKKFIILLSFMTIVSCINAQDIDVLKKENDSLKLEVKELRKNFEYFYCYNELVQLEQEIKIYANNVNTSANGININYEHLNYDFRLNQAYKDNYRSIYNYFKLLESNLKDKLAQIEIKKEKFDFNDSDIFILENAIKKVYISLNAAESAIEHYKVIVNAYDSLD